MGPNVIFFFLNSMNWPRETFPRNSFQLLCTGGDARRRENFRRERSPGRGQGVRWPLGTAEALPQRLLPPLKSLLTQSFLYLYSGPRRQSSSGV